MKQSITTELVRDLTQHPPAKVTDIWDTRQPRFVLRARPNGHHSYRVLLGRGRWFTLGIVGGLKPEKARSEAQRRLGEVASGGEKRRPRTNGGARSVVLLAESPARPGFARSREACGGLRHQNAIAGRKATGGLQTSFRSQPARRMRARRRSTRPA